MTQKIAFIIVALFASLVGLYPAIYFLIDRKFGLLQTKDANLLADLFWNGSFYIHITLGGLALLIGWTQFVVKLRTNKLQLHRQIGKVYIIASLLSATAGISIAFYATGGIISSMGFIFLGIVWFYTTLKAYLHIKKGRIAEHQKMMIYSYAACLSAVTLRLYLPLLILLFRDFIKAYLIVAWLCWIPNILIAFVLVKRMSKKTEELVQP